MNRWTWSSLCAALALLLSPGIGRAADDPPAESPAAVKAALEAAYASSEDEPMVEAIGQAAGMKDPAVIALVVRGLKTKRIAVMDAAIDALGATDHPDAEKALRNAAAAARTRDLSGFETVYAHLLKEIGRQGDKAGIDALTEKPFNALTYDVGMARLMGLSRIRDRASIEALIELSRLAGGRGAKSGALSVDRGQFRPAFRVAMCVLTGRDEGLVPADWEKWWRNHGEGFKVAAERPPVPDDVRKAWEAYWGESYLPEGREAARAAGRLAHHPRLEPDAGAGDGGRRGPEGRLQVEELRHDRRRAGRVRGRPGLQGRPRGGRGAALARRRHPHRVDPDARLDEGPGRPAPAAPRVPTRALGVDEGGGHLRGPAPGHRPPRRPVLHRRARRRPLPRSDARHGSRADLRARQHPPEGLGRRADQGHAAGRQQPGALGSGRGRDALPARVLPRPPRPHRRGLRQRSREVAAVVAQEQGHLRRPQESAAPCRTG